MASYSALTKHGAVRFRQYVRTGHMTALFSVWQAGRFSIRHLSVSFFCGYVKIALIVTENCVALAGRVDDQTWK